MKLTMSPQRSILAIAVALTLAACSSEDKDSTIIEKTHAQSSLTARAADGYLIGANACLDLNANKTCDGDEPSTMTGENGEFTLNDLTPEQIATGSVLIEVIAGQTKDADYGDAPLTKSYRLTAPPGSHFVSPLTTLVQNEIENGLTVEKAKAAVQARLGTTQDLAADYVEGKSSPAVNAANQQEFARLHRIAQVTATIMAENTDKLQEVAAGAGINVEQLTSLIAEEVLKTISNVVASVDNAGEDFDPIKTGQDINTQHVGINDVNLNDKVNTNEAAKSATQANLAELMLTDSLHWFSGEKSDEATSLSYGLVKLDKNNQVVDQEYELNDTTNTFIPITDMTNTEQLILDKDGWEAESNAIVKILLNEDGSIVLQTNNSVKDAKVSAKKMDLSGLNVSTVLKKSADDDVWASMMPQDLNFPANTFAYLVSSENLEGGFYSFNKGSWCKNDAGDRYVTLNQMCNGISAIKNQQDTWITSLADTVATNANSRQGTLDSVDLIPMAGLKEGLVFAQLLADGNVIYYSRSNEWSDSFAQFADKGAWRDITHHGTTLREVGVPDSIAEETTWSNFNQDDNKLYLAEVEGFVRVTHFVEQDDDADTDYLFDATAAQLIIDRVEKPTPPSL